MATESDLRDLLRDPDPRGGGAIDVDAVLRRARSRRRPRVVAASAAGALALAAVFTPIVLTSIPRTTGADASYLSTEDSAGGQAAPLAGDTAPSRKAAESLSACGAPIAEVDAPANGLVLEVAPMTADASTDPIVATVTLRNAGTLHLLGTTGIGPALTLSQDGVVLWHSNGASDLIAVPIDLAPGETYTYSAEFRPVRCAPEDDAEGFRDELPAAGPGTYALGAAIDFVPDDGSAAILVTGPLTTVELRAG